MKYLCLNLLTHFPILGCYVFVEKTLGKTPTIFLFLLHFRSIIIFAALCGYNFLNKLPIKFISVLPYAFVRATSDF